MERDLDFNNAVRKRIQLILNATGHNEETQICLSVQDVVRQAAYAFSGLDANAYCICMNVLIGNLYIAEYDNIKKYDITATIKSNKNGNEETQIEH